MTTLTFQNTTLSVINQHNQTFITANDLGLALEYAVPMQAILKIYDRNADEFTPEMTALIETRTACLVMVLSQPNEHPTRSTRKTT